MYYLAIVQNNNTKALYDYESYDAALAAFHSELAYRGEGRTSTKCALLDANLSMIRQEVYGAETVTNEEPQEA